MTIQLELPGDETDEREVKAPTHVLTVEGYDKPFHHVRTRDDGVWVYAPVSR